MISLNPYALPADYAELRSATADEVRTVYVQYIDT